MHYQNRAHTICKMATMGFLPAYQLETKIDKCHGQFDALDHQYAGCLQNNDENQKIEQLCAPLYVFETFTFLSSWRLLFGVH